MAKKIRETHVAESNLAKLLISLVLELSESQHLNAYQMLQDEKNQESKYQIKLLGSKKFGSYLYDLATIPIQSKSIDGTQSEKRLFLAVSSKSSPIKFYDFCPSKDSVNFKSYSSFSQFKPSSEQYIQALAMCYEEEGQNLFLGGKNTLLAVDINKFQVVYRSKLISKKTILSCMDLPEKNPNSILAAGFFDKSIKIIEPLQDTVIAELKAHVGGVTSVKFSPFDNNVLFSGARRDNLVYMWDLRNTSRFVTYFERRSQTNQRMSFDVSQDNCITFGNEDGTVISYNTKDSSLKYYFQASNDIVNNISYLPISQSPSKNEQLMLGSIGQRRFFLDSENLEGKRNSSAGNDDDDKVLNDNFNEQNNELNEFSQELAFLSQEQLAKVQVNQISLWSIPIDSSYSYTPNLQQQTEVQQNEQKQEVSEETVGKNDNNVSDNNEVNKEQNQNQKNNTTNSEMVQEISGEQTQQQQSTNLVDEKEETVQKEISNQETEKQNQQTEGKIQEETTN